MYVEAGHTKQHDLKASSADSVITIAEPYNSNATAGEDRHKQEKWV